MIGASRHLFQIAILYRFFNDPPLPPFHRQTMEVKKLQPRYYVQIPSPSHNAPRIRPKEENFFFFKKLIAVIPCISWT